MDAGDIETRSRHYLTPTDYDYRVGHDDMAYLVEMAKRAEASQKLLEVFLAERERRLATPESQRITREWQRD